MMLQSQFNELLGSNNDGLHIKLHAEVTLTSQLLPLCTTRFGSFMDVIFREMELMDYHPTTCYQELRQQNKNVKP